MASNMTGKRIKILRHHNGGEYTSNVFDEYLKSKGIQMQLLVPRKPEQNGVSERMNRTIQEMARSVIHGAGLSDIYWAEAVFTTVIIRNRSPTTAVPNITPYECFYGKKPDVSNFKLSGCTAYAHTSKEHREKWDVNSVKCILVGCSIHSKGYRLWDPKDKRIHMSRAVIFFEQDFDGRIIGSKEQSEPKSVSEIVRDDEEAENENQLVDENDDGSNDNNKKFKSEMKKIYVDQKELEGHQKEKESLQAIGGNLQKMLHIAL